MSTATTNPTHPSPLKALIIGGGIAGPACALFLHRVGIHATIYESHQFITNIGGILGLAPNGLRVLDSLGLADKILKQASVTEEMMMRNHYGMTLGAFPTGKRSRYGFPSILVRRSVVHETLVQATKEAGITIEYGKKVLRVEETDEKVVVYFDDGAAAQGDILFGCDGIRSTVRDHVLAFSGHEKREPHYTGLVGVGGFIPSSLVPNIDPKAEPPVIMTHGPSGIFAYGYLHANNEWIWWSTFEATEEQARGDIRSMPDDELLRKLFAKHGTWPSPIPELIKAETGPMVRLPIYDVDPLPVWHSGRVVLTGDAAHAVAPHSGQGVSLALEDAAVLGKCLREAGTEVRAAFVAYENARKARVTMVVEEGRRRGQAKKEMGFIACWIRDIVMMVMAWWLTDSALDEWFGYTVDGI
ncbi:hypothetical protein BC936DRAFT_145737 [Jimgerdemannia flammicorona]|uniref:FAD-binding domain-containing protein n=1 Tax=Jimgerdemannia flammicorona TaxID=994334 RepID=A0A433D980_9FUNG|nr:hypothetical protein BC936DRAFT_145737 [Jimgerdemannia flammicorona]